MNQENSNIKNGIIMFAQTSTIAFILLSILNTLNFYFIKNNGISPISYEIIILPLMFTIPINLLVQKKEKSYLWNTIDICIIFISGIFLILTTYQFYIGGINPYLFIFIYPILINAIYTPEYRYIYVIALDISLIALDIFQKVGISPYALILFNISIIITSEIYRIFGKDRNNQLEDFIKRQGQVDTYIDNQRQQINFLSNIKKIMTEYLENISNVENIELLKMKLKLFFYSVTNRISILNQEPNNIIVFNFNQIFTEIFQELYPYIETKNLQINYLPYTRETLKLNTDKNKIKTIILNTLENAMKYSSNSAIISVRTQEVGKRVEVYIQNYNEQFENVDYSSPIMKSSKEGKGEGFGLYIAMQYAKDTKTTMRVFKDYANLVTSEINIPIAL